MKIVTHYDCVDDCPIVYWMCRSRAFIIGYTTLKLSATLLILDILTEVNI